MEDRTLDLIWLSWLCETNCSSSNFRDLNQAILAMIQFLKKWDSNSSFQSHKMHFVLQFTHIYHLSCLSRYNTRCPTSWWKEHKFEWFRRRIYHCLFPSLISLAWVGLAKCRLHCSKCLSLHPASRSTSNYTVASLIYITTCTCIQH